MDDFMEIFKGKHFRFYDNVQDIIVDWVRHSVYFMDAESGDDYEILRKEAYLKADCILLCYSIANKSSFKNVYKKWCLEIRKVAPFVPLVLVGKDAFFNFLLKQVALG